jgi:hypothetical protein
VFLYPKVDGADNNYFDLTLIRSLDRTHEVNCKYSAWLFAGSWADVTEQWRFLSLSPGPLLIPDAPCDSHTLERRT